MRKPVSLCPPAAVHTLMLDDLTHGMPLDLNDLSAEVSRLGCELEIPTPAHDFATIALHPPY